MISYFLRTSEKYSATASSGSAGPFRPDFAVPITLHVIPQLSFGFATGRVGTDYGDRPAHECERSSIVRMYGMSPLRLFYEESHLCKTLAAFAPSQS